MRDALRTVSSRRLTASLRALDMSEDRMLVRGAIIALCRPYAHADVRLAYRAIMGRGAALSASLEDMGGQLAERLVPRARARQRPRRRDTSPAACRRALGGEG